MASIDAVQVGTAWFDVKVTPAKVTGGNPGGQNKDNEWWTPPIYTEAAAEVMGGEIDLDPASCEMANGLVKARRYFTEADNGLLQPWCKEDGTPARVWLNPPYGKVGNTSMIKLFVNKLVAEYEAGNVSEAVLLATSDTDASWFHQLWQFLICFSKKNVYFYRPDEYGTIEMNTRHGHWFGTVFVYLGPNRERFTQVFSQFGAVR